MKVGIFDSGIGGLTVLKRIIEKYPNNEYIYYGDTLNVPYGTKTINELKQLSSNDVEFLISKNVDIIIIACGTISSNCIDYLNNKYNIPIYDIINPTIKHLNNSNYNNIGIIATDRTIDSHIFKKNLNNKLVYEIKTSKLASLIENNQLKDINNILDEYLSPYKDKLDLLVLGCTHYPIIKDIISNYFNNKVDILEMNDMLLDKVSNGNNLNVDIYYSKLDDLVIKNTKRILKIDNINIHQK